jgi:hypothetical protein
MTCAELAFHILANSYPSDLSTRELMHDPPRFPPVVGQQQVN